ncbi:sarcosine oxidase subunit gamma [Bordetella sp. BOR01]|uniref:sarcosine oxidase subunit gamma n=1 Tax=Bordetella sp. BOR01 TaxID=2854779 RepID=UPI001C46680A|nr:sarcosine oxidase subunit gamma family protein [Bordetella sp. BOR01]MBV7481816.1 sarcosine oxidase subunit gamma [Bordetella sp. BOR01]
MSNSLRQRSPLADSSRLPFLAGPAAGPSVSLVESPFLPMLSLRGSPSDPAFMAAAEAVLGFALPVAPNTYTGANTHVAMWMGPDEWLVQGLCPQAAPELPTQLASRLAGRFAAAIDITSGYTVVDVTGPRAADVLAKGCPLDMHPQVFGPGCCAQTCFFDAAVVLRRTEAGISLTTRRSFAPYVAELLVDGALEFA